MTLILTRASAAFVLQVADRLVSRQGRPYDECANKSILYGARDAMVAIAYSGLAYLGEIATDQWIVEKLTGLPFNRHEPLPAWQALPRGGPWRDIGMSVYSLACAVENAPGTDIRNRWRRDWTDKDFHVQVTGYQWNTKGRYRPVRVDLLKPEGTDRVYLHWTTRHWHLGRKLILSAVPRSNTSPSEMHGMMQKVRDQEPDEVEAFLVDTIRTVAKRLPVVGEDCTSILLWPPEIGKARLRFIPARQPAKDYSVLLSAADTVEHQVALPLAYTPWLVTPRLIVAPCAMTGSGLSVSLGRYSVDIEAPDNPNGVVYAEWSSQERRGPPT